MLNVVTGGEATEQKAYGDFLDKAQRYARYAEFLDIVTQLWRGETVSYDGVHLRVEGARRDGTLNAAPFAPTSGPAALTVR